MLKTVFCSLCQSPSHTNCLNLYSPTDIDYTNNNSNNWSCPTCYRDNFPFTQVDNQQEFISLFQPHAVIDHTYHEQLIFNPYDLNEEGGGSSMISTLIPTSITPTAKLSQTPNIWIQMSLTKKSTQRPTLFLFYI